MAGSWNLLIFRMIGLNNLADSLHALLIFELIKRILDQIVKLSAHGFWMVRIFANAIDWQLRLISIVFIFIDHFFCFNLLFLNMHRLLLFSIYFLFLKVFYFIYYLSQFKLFRLVSIYSCIFYLYVEFFLLIWIFSLNLVYVIKVPAYVFIL